jgi:hypothetical protein
VVGSIEVLHVALTEISHQGRAGQRRGWRHQKMNMVCHQAVCVNTAIERLGQHAELMQVYAVVDVVPEAIAAVIAALDDMQRHIRKDQSRLTSHSAKTNRRVRPLT